MSASRLGLATRIYGCGAFTPLLNKPPRSVPPKASGSGFACAAAKLETENPAATRWPGRRSGWSSEKGPTVGASLEFVERQKKRESVLLPF